jgi:RNA polymerase sigma factor (sigma-70 family)
MKVERKFDDIELIAAIRDKKTLNQAILFIYQQYSDTVSSFIIHYGGSRQDAQDIFQETTVAFIDIVENGKFRMEASIKTFLVSIARNIWFNDLRKKERSGQREKMFENNREQKEMDVSQFIGDRELKQQLSELLSQLGEPCRKILLLFYYESLSMKEMLDHLPYENEQVVRNKKYKCLLQLTEIIKGHPQLAKQISELIK